MSIWITNAPPVYDYEWTLLDSGVLSSRFSDQLGLRPSQHPFRRVELDDREGGYYAEYQCNRYRSGGYRVMSLAQYEKEVREGFIVDYEQE